MALKITILSSDPLLRNTPIQATRYYVHLAGIHYIKDENTGSLPVRYYAITDNNMPSGPQLTGSGLPEIVPILRPMEILASQSEPAVLICYRLVAEHLLAACAPGATVENLF
ncbi:hypothetical protein [Hymenobacter sp.]|uniref:hypothetical protein n=1 Tax=Hymenobacter sp. TaxID=1898978 RepID=UPI00286BB3AF|nr:hypothetical protein [Hymenobacter sp.]